MEPSRMKRSLAVSLAVILTILAALWAFVAASLVMVFDLKFEPFGIQVTPLGALVGLVVCAAGAAWFARVARRGGSTPSS